MCVGAILADGKFFTWNYEHTESWPLSRGWSIHAIDVFTGEAVWEMMGCTTPSSIADGYLVGNNIFTGYVYCYGKGESETTVTASPKTIARGAEVLIEGKVLDLSPAQPGTPCVSKDSMATQMEYLHYQMPIDGLWHNETITGVPVALCAIGDDGSYYDLGTVTTSGYYGTFGLAWTPPAEGTYEIIAAFDGDASYGSSGDSTYISVGPAASVSTAIQPEPEQPTPQEPTPEQPTPEEPTESTPEQPKPEEPTPEEPEPTVAEHPLISAELALVIAVIVVAIIGAVAYLVFRRRK